jgi:hypothetical protein
MLSDRKKVSTDLDAPINSSDRGVLHLLRKIVSHASILADVGMPFGYPWISIPGPVHYGGGQVQGVED